jgi:hypothetical protein
MPNGIGLLEPGLIPFFRSIGHCAAFLSSLSGQNA